MPEKYPEGLSSRRVMVNWASVTAKRLPHHPWLNTEQSDVVIDFYRSGFRIFCLLETMGNTIVSLVYRYRTTSVVYSSWYVVLALRLSVDN